MAGVIGIAVALGHGYLVQRKMVRPIAELLADKRMADDVSSAPSGPGGGVPLLRPTTIPHSGARPARSLYERSPPEAAKAGGVVTPGWRC